VSTLYICSLPPSSLHVLPLCLAPRSVDCLLIADSNDDINSAASLQAWTSLFEKISKVEFVHIQGSLVENLHRLLGPRIDIERISMDTSTRLQPIQVLLLLHTLVRVLSLTLPMIPARIPTTLRKRSVRSSPLAQSRSVPSNAWL